MKKLAITVIALVTVSSLANSMWRSFDFSWMLWVTLLVCAACVVISGIMATGSTGTELRLSRYMMMFSVLKAVSLTLVVLDVPWGLFFLVVHDLATLFVVGLAGAYLTPRRMSSPTRGMLSVIIQYKVVVILGTLTTAMGENAWLGRIHFDLMEWIPIIHALLSSVFLATVFIVARRFPLLIIAQIIMFLTGALNLVNTDVAAILHTVITPTVTAMLCYYIVMDKPVKKANGKELPNPNAIWS
mgnify:FL=1